MLNRLRISWLWDQIKHSFRFPYYLQHTCGPFLSVNFKIMITCTVLCYSWHNIWSYFQLTLCWKWTANDHYWSNKRQAGFIIGHDWKWDKPDSRWAEPRLETRVVEGRWSIKHVWAFVYHSQQARKIQQTLTNYVNIAPDPRQSLVTNKSAQVEHPHNTFAWEHTGQADS